jgi:putative addiction module killer protein
MLVRRTDEFQAWIRGLRDRRAAAKIAVRIARMESGLLGDVEPVGEGVSEVRVDYGPGYRLYFVRRGQEVIILLCGGDKRSQKRDIKRAKAMAKEV